MERELSKVSKTLIPSPIQELSHLAQRCGPSISPRASPISAPDHIKNAAASAINSDLNQYRASTSCQQRGWDKAMGSRCCGQSEAFAATMFAIIDEGDGVLLLDPAYETYETCIGLAGGVPVYVLLDPRYSDLNVDRFMKSFTSRAKALVLNSLHNPTGKVFSKEELDAIAGACREMDRLTITTEIEVYEYITYGMHKRTSLASFPGKQERIIITSSLSKTFYVTGWRIGWACAPAKIASAIRNIHIKITDSAPAAALASLRSPPTSFESLKTYYERKRNCIVAALSGLGFNIQFQPQESVFVFAEIAENWQLSNDDFVRELIKRKAGVAAVPCCGFFHTKYNGEKHQQLQELVNGNEFLRLR